MTEKIKKFSTGFTQVSNVVLTDPNLSLKAKAIYAYLFSKPDGWVFHIGVMKSEIKESRGTIYSAIKELINKKYIKRNQKNGGCFGAIEYEFIDVLPFTKNPHTVKPHTENYNTNNTKNINNKYNNNITPISPKRDSRVDDIIYIMKKIVNYHTNREPNTERWYSSLERWLKRNNIEPEKCLFVVRNYYNSIGEDEYMPKVRDLRELFSKFSRLEDYFTDF